MTDERRDDEILGRALARAIETIDVNETPFEKSRVAIAPARRSIFGLWQMAGAVAAIVLALGIGSWLTRPTEDQRGVAASPTATPLASAATRSPTPSPTPVVTVAPGQLDHYKVYFARDGLPPVGAHVDNAGVGATARERIASRLASLQSAAAPAGASNVFPQNSGTQAIAVNASSGVVVNGDLVTVDYIVPQGDWKVRGSAQSLALLQQLVYTATEEPGIRRVLITENGGNTTRIDQLVWDTPLRREDVFGYSSEAKTGAIYGIADGGNTTARYQVGVTTSVDTLASGLARVVLTFKSPEGADVTELPEFAATLEASDDGVAARDAKYALVVQLRAGQVTWMSGDTVIDRTPLRAFRVNGSGIRIGLDDARPWRLFTLTGPARIVIDVGGPIHSVSDRVAVYQPRPGATVTRDLQVTGAARTFEANVNWRLLDSTGREVASGAFTGGSSGPLWGVFDTRIAVPTSVSGNVTLEVFEASAKDGSPQGVTQIPLTVR
jgi:hypothetical protein